MWVVCTVCGAIVAEFGLHADWHVARGEPRPVNPNDPLAESPNDPPAEPVQGEPIQEVPDGG